MTKGPIIGVFDSGFGGLTVLRALLPLIPGAHYVYLGDTARLPYGSKSRETIVRYALSSAHFLHAQGATLLVIACNTATALALEEIQAALPIPVIGVIQPGAHAALEVHTRTSAGQVLVLATSATVQSHAYMEALTKIGLNATEKACPLLVPLVEEDWLQEPAKIAVTAEVLRIYLSEAIAEAATSEPKILLLGCTHYPLLTSLIEQTLIALNHPMVIIDSAAATARAVAAQLPGNSSIAAPTCIFYATDSVEKFQRLGSAFLGQDLDEVHLLDLGG
ncbi:glutamate racemase [Granulicella sp. dw_53]|uniref:glutamate racemase n=1 Tax=Granulicella sp. dw_53 TaxID=2719792 RepID=UPI001BD5EEE7|nr:glutamate racemase [Granulicella sp. dw_53]